MLLSKFDVAERQLLQAIRMFFGDEDPVSIHTLAEAAAQVLNDIGDKYGAKSIFRDSDKIREEKMKEWLGHIFKSRNFFKHANRDKDELHEFKDEFNDFSLLDAINMYTTIKQKWVPETLVYLAWFAVAHPNLMKDGTDWSKMFEAARQDGNLPDPLNKQILLKSIKAMRQGIYGLDNLTLEYGLRA